MSLVWNFILNVVGIAIALWVVVTVVPGIELSAVHSSRAGTFIAAASIFVFVNWLIAPVIRFLSAPITCATLGLFTLVINGAMLLIVEKLFNAFAIGDMNITGLLPAIFGAVILSTVSGVVNFFTHPLRNL